MRKRYIAQTPRSVVAGVDTRDCFDLQSRKKNLLNPTKNFLKIMKIVTAFKENIFRYPILVVHHFLRKKYLNAIKKTSEKRIVCSCHFCGASAYYIIRPFVRREFDMGHGNRPLEVLLRSGQFWNMALKYGTVA